MMLHKCNKIKTNLLNFVVFSVLSNQQAFSLRNLTRCLAFYKCPAGFYFSEFLRQGSIE